LLGQDKPARKREDFDNREKWPTLYHDLSMGDLAFVRPNFGLIKIKSMHLLKLIGRALNTTRFHNHDGFNHPGTFSGLTP
jgi:hypothetical protein